MINNLKTCSPVMFRVFMSFKERQTSGPPITQEDIEIASGKRVLDPGQTKVYFKNLESASEGLRLAFEKQAKNAAVPVFLLCFYALINLRTGTMGSRQIRTTHSRMGCCL
jgi:hypothetical protein